MMIDLLVEKFYVYSDYIELILHYADESIKTPITYKNDESPEGTSLRGNLIFTGYICFNNYFMKKDAENLLNKKAAKLVKCS